MKILIVMANPKPECFTRRMVDTFVEAARANGHETTLRDLYEMEFNPVATHDDLVGNLEGKVAPDIAHEQSLIEAADLIVLAHPIWWIDRPAILKGYIDRVFALGFAYGYSTDRELGSLAPRKAIILTSSGSTNENFAETGKADAIATAQDRYTMEFCGLELLEHLNFGPVGRRSTPEQIEGYLGTIKTLVVEKL